MSWVPAGQEQEQARSDTGRAVDALLGAGPEDRVSEKTILRLEISVCAWTFPLTGT